MKEDVDDARMPVSSTRRARKCQSGRGLRCIEGAALLSTAVDVEESGYQALLKLQARETFGQPRQRQRLCKGSRTASANLDQLDLKDSENQYETQRKSHAANPEQREQVNLEPFERSSRAASRMVNDACRASNCIAGSENRAERQRCVSIETSARRTAWRLCRMSISSSRK